MSRSDYYAIRAIADADPNDPRHFMRLVDITVGGRLTRAEEQLVRDGFASDLSVEQVAAQIRAGRERQLERDRALVSQPIEHDYTTCTDKTCRWYECEQRRKRRWGRAVAANSVDCYMSCPVCEPDHEGASLLVTVQGTRRDLTADVIRCLHGCTLTPDQRDRIEQAAIDMALAGELA